MMTVSIMTKEKDSHSLRISALLNFFTFEIRIYCSYIYTFLIALIFFS